jgi:hypothetical protein
MDNSKNTLISKISDILSKNSNELDYRKFELTTNINHYLIYTKEKDNLTSSIKDILSKKKSDGIDNIYSKYSGNDTLSETKSYDSVSVTPTVSGIENSNESKTLSKMIKKKCKFNDDVSISINTYLLRKKKIDECNKEILKKLKYFITEGIYNTDKKRKENKIDEITNIIGEVNEKKQNTKLNKFMNSIIKNIKKYEHNKVFTEISKKYRRVHGTNDEIYDSVKKIHDTKFYRDSTRDKYCNKIKPIKKEKEKEKEVRKLSNIHETTILNESRTNNYIPSDTCINTNIIKNTISITITSNNLHKENITHRILNGLNQLSFIKQIN